jgi:hypothetical protein
MMLLDRLTVGRPSNTVGAYGLVHAGAVFEVATPRNGPQTPSRGDGLCRCWRSDSPKSV